MPSVSNTESFIIWRWMEFWKLPDSYLLSWNSYDKHRKTKSHHRFPSRDCCLYIFVLICFIAGEQECAELLMFPSWTPESHQSKSFLCLLFLGSVHWYFSTWAVMKIHAYSLYRRCDFLYIWNCVLNVKKSLFVASKIA